MKLMKFNAKITYKVDGSHPDIKGVPEKYWNGKVFTYEDTYSFDVSLWTHEEAVEYIKHDLQLVAGGGYNANHIYAVNFEIEEVV